MNGSNRKTLLAGFVTLLVGGAAVSQAAPRFWNTGEGLVSFDRDSHWVAEKVQGSSVFEGSQSAWVMDTSIYPVNGAYNRTSYSNSQWISFTRDAYCNNDDIFRFTTTFTIDGSQGSGIGLGGGLGDAGYRFTGKFSSDNASELYVNGHLVSSIAYYGTGGYSFEVAKDFDGTAYLQNGLNTVSVLVGSANTMGANVGPVTEWMGLRVEGTVAPVPEPASLIAVGLGAAWAARRRRAKSSV
jgi:hypothetical protein